MTKIACLAVLLVCILLLAAAVHLNPSYTWYGCFFEAPECSESVSTVGLIAFGALAFFAAIDAGNWAKRTLEHERAPVVSIEQCNRSCSERRCEAVYLVKVNKGFEAVADPRAQYQIYDFEVHNVGKVALGELRASVVYIINGGTKSKPLSFDLGQIAAGARLHGELHITAELLDGGDLEWDGITGKIPRLGSEPSEVKIEIFKTTSVIKVPLTTSWGARTQAAMPANTPNPQRPTTAGSTLADLPEARPLPGSVTPSETASSANVVAPPDATA